MATPSVVVQDNTVRHGIYWERLLALAPFLLAVFFGLWSLRDIRGSSIADYDSPRHAMNGAFMLDIVRHGKLAHPVEFGYWYYSRLPALSIPYHPPVFPAFEALLYSILGVNSLSARLAMAIATAVAVLLLFRLVLKSHGSGLLALLVTASFFVLPIVQKLSNIVMLEVPALVFVLAALRFLIPDEQIFQNRRTLCFALFAAAAIWTKQTVFLLALPFIYVPLSGRWGLLRKAYFWSASLLVAASAAALAWTDRQLNWNGINQSWAKKSVLEYFSHNWHYYIRFGGMALILVAVCLLTYRMPSGREDLRKERLYIAWLIAVILVLLPSPAYSPRYLFFAFPPLLVVIYSALERFGRHWFPKHGYAIGLAVCLVFITYGLIRAPLVFLRGPDEAAHFLHEKGHRRVLYCGNATNGAFIFAVRSYDPALTTIVIRGDKLADDNFVPEQLNAFINRYGVDSVVLERISDPQAWDMLAPGTLPFLSLERVQQMSNSSDWKEGSLSIYRVNNPTKVPKSSLQVPISVLGRDVELQF